MNVAEIINRLNLNIQESTALLALTEERIADLDGDLEEFVHNLLDWVRAD